MSKGTGFIIFAGAALLALSSSSQAASSFDNSSGQMELPQQPQPQNTEQIISSPEFQEQATEALQEADIQEVVYATQPESEKIQVLTAGITPQELDRMNTILPATLPPPTGYLNSPGAVDNREIFEVGGRIYETTIRAETAPKDAITGLTDFEKAQALAGASNIGSGPGSGDEARAVLAADGQTEMTTTKVSTTTPTYSSGGSSSSRTTTSTKSPVRSSSGATRDYRAESYKKILARRR